MKHLLTLTLLCLGFLAQAQIPSYVPTNGLVGWWPFNGNANDESGNGNHGTVNGATLAADRFGNAGKAYSFDGSSKKIVIQNTLLSNGFSSHTTAVWIKTSSHLDQMIYSDRGPSSYWYKNSSAIFSATGGWNHASHNNNCVNSGVTSGQQTVWDGVWHHMISIFDTQTFTIRLYQDGVLIANQSNINANCYGNVSTPTTIGCVSGGGYPDAGFFNGSIDDIAIYNRALSASEVQQLYLGACAKPTFAAQPQNKSVAQGQTTTFAVQVDSASRYQWQMNLGLGAGWTNIPVSALFSGDTTATLSVQGRSTIDGAQFRCIATSCNADTSNAATLTVTSSATAAAGTVAGVPGLINYQGNALDSAGKPMKNQTISLKLSVLDSSSSGAAVFVETHTATTNVSGHFAIQIGGGTAMLGSFDSVGWANGRNKYLKTELSQNGTWVNLGTSQLVSVPYALHAGSAEKASYATFFKDSLGNAYQIKTVNGQPTLVAAPGSGNASNPGTFACGQAVNYAGESYPTVQIGTQCWFQKNLNVGSMVLGANDQTNNSVLEKYCYDNDPANCAIYGGLYQWAEAVQYQNGASNTASPNPAFSGNIKGICPNGWHVPSDGEWCTLSKFLDSVGDCRSLRGNSNNAGGAMFNTDSLWDYPLIGADDNSGFSAFPGGIRNSGRGFNSLGEGSLFMSNSESSINTVYQRSISNSYLDLLFGIANKVLGASIRCLKD